MRKITGIANEYIRRCTWVDLAFLKLCLCSIGVLIGLCLPKEKKLPAVAAASAVFLATYLPLMDKFMRVVFLKESGKRRPS